MAGFQNESSLTGKREGKQHGEKGAGVKAKVVLGPMRHEQVSFSPSHLILS